MRNIGKTIALCVFLFIAGQNGFAQTATPDSLRLKDKQGETVTENNGENGKRNAYGQAKGNNKVKSVKQVKSGRPDMSKARGARPPLIVRPSGSGIPRGAGKPAGVGKKGGR